MILKLTKEEFYAWLAEVKSTDISKHDKKFLGEMRIAAFYKCTMLAITGENSDDILSVLCYTITKGYLNIYYHYTLPDCRREGLSYKLFEWCIENEPFDRIYARASSDEARGFYKKHGFTFYGLDKAGSTLVEKHIRKTNAPIKSSRFLVGAGTNETQLNLL
jgi:ribosomal protein S18 acetylase RimI-like enzyme